MSITCEKDVVSALLNFEPFTAIGASLRNGEPPLDAPLPWASYQITSAAPDVDDDLAGSGSMVRYTLAVGMAASNYANLRTLHDAIRAGLDGHMGGQLVYCQWTGSDLSLVDEGKHTRYGQIEFELVGKEAAVLPAESGVPVVEVRQDGLYFDGEKIGQQGPPGETPDLSDYARKDTANTFTATQTVRPASSGAVALVAKGVASQTGDLVQFQDSTGGIVANVSASGKGGYSDLDVYGHGGQGGTATIAFLPFGGNGAFLMTNQQIAFTNLGTFSLASGNTGWTPIHANSQTSALTLRGVVFRHADEPVIEASDGSRWQIKVSTSGVLSTVAV